MRKHSAAPTPSHLRPQLSQFPLRMNTKLSQIEKSLKLKYRLENNTGSDPHGGTGGLSGQPMRAPSAGGGGPTGIGGGDGGGFGHPRNRENEQLVEELHRYNSVLLRENSDLKTKIKVKKALMAQNKMGYWRLLVPCASTTQYLTGKNPSMRPIAVS